MSDQSLWTIFLNACLINNFVLAYFLGICPFLGVSSKIDTATADGRRGDLRDADHARSSSPASTRCWRRSTRPTWR